MDFLSHLQPITVLLSFLLILLCRLLRNTKPKSKSDKMEAPTPPGAWPVIGHLHLLTGPNPVYRTLGDLADAHGPVFSLRLGGPSRVLVVSSWEAVRDCFTTNDKAFATRPDIAVARRVGYNRASFSLSPHGAHWRDIRKIATSELFSSIRLDKLRRVRGLVVDSYVKHLRERCLAEEPVAVNQWFERLAISMTARVVAGRRYSAESYDEEDGEAARVRRALKETLYRSGVFVPSDSMPWLERLDIGGHLGAMDRLFRELDMLLERWAEEHGVDRKRGKRTTTTKKKMEVKSEEDEESDFMEVMFSKFEKDASMDSLDDTTIIVKATALTLMLTGTESTSLTLTWALSLLLNNPKALQKALQELDTHVGKSRWVQESDVKNLVFLQAIVKEALRLFPPGPVSGPREAMEDCVIAGYHVPKGTRLLVNLWKLHRDPRMWDRPDEFCPERFLTEHAGLGFRGLNFEYIPFSSGRRACPAITYGMQVVHFTLARLLQGFNVATPGGSPVDMREGLGIALPKVAPLNVVLSPRLAPELYELLQG